MRSLFYSSFVLMTERKIIWLCSRLLGKDEVASSNLAISSMNLEHVASMGPGFFCTLLQGPGAPKHLLIVSQGREE